MEHLSIEEKALQIYQENLLFFQETDLHLYKKIQAFEVALEKGFYTEKYALEYKDEGYFDVKELSTGNYLYGQDSNNYAKLAAASVNYEKVDNLFETFYDMNFEKVDKETLETVDLIEYNKVAVASLINYSNEHAHKSNTTMIKLYKFVFIGVGLGTHITTIHEKLQSNAYFIVEDDLELFRLSLFVTNYKQIASNGSELYISVFDESQDFKNILQAFINAHYVYNHYIKFFCMLSHSDKKLKDIQNILATQTHLTFNYAALMTSLLRPLEYLENGYKLLNIATSYEETILAKKPVLLIGAGPSFDDNLEWFKKNHSRFIIVIVSALMAKFEEIGIKPDIITHLHGFADAMPHIEKVKDMNFFDETIGLFGGMSYPQFTAKFKKENIFIFEGSSRYKKDFGGLTSSNIGAASYGLMLLLDVSKCFLLGLDFATDQKTGQTHANVHAHTRQVDLTLKEEVGGAIIVKDEIMEVEGNFEEKVYTSVLFDAMRRECNAIAKTFYNAKNITYNLSHGAKIENTQPLELNSPQIVKLETIDKKVLYKELLKTFNQRSENFLTDEELKDIKLRLEYYDSIIEILKKHTTLPHGDINQYHYNLLGTFKSILTENNQDKHSSDMNYIITLYLEFVSGYIFDLINTKEIKNKKKLMKQLDKVVIPQITRVVSYFRDIMQKHYNILKNNNIV
jgi:hypothetical protein